MSEMPEEILYDVRLVERHIRKGTITREQANGYVEAAEDMGDQAEVLDLDALRQGRHVVHDLAEAAESQSEN